MAHRFVYARPRARDLALYLVALASILAALARWGDAWWREVAAHTSLCEAIVGWGFAFYFVWFWLLGLTYFALDDARARAAALPHEQRSWLGRALLRWEIQQPLAEQPRRPDVPRRRTVLVVLRNQLLGTWPSLLLVSWLLARRGVTIHDPIPTSATIVAQLLGIVLMLEVAFYTVHRVLHGKSLFRRIHRVHHEWRKPTGVATHYVHYVEHLCGNLLPVFLGPVLLGVHPLVFGLWAGIAVFNAIHTHGGYAIPGLVYAHDHDFHHYRLRGNYGSLGLLDALLGTNREFVQLGEREG